MESSVEKFERPGVKGWLHLPDKPRAAMALTHGAAGNCEAPLLVAVAKAFAESRYAVLRYDLPYRQLRRSGSPSSAQGKDRDGIRLAVAALRTGVPGVPTYLSGHSYGGRQSTMVAAEDLNVADGLLLLSYPLHPVGQPEKLRTEHFPALRVPAMFVHGTRDGFGSIAEMEAALKLIPGRTKLIPVERAG